MATELTLLLTQTSTGSQIRLSDDNLIRVYPIASGTGSNVLYHRDGAYPVNIVVNETAAKVAGMSKQLIQVTETGVTAFINARRIITVDTDPNGGGGSQIEYDVEGARNAYLIVTETPSTIQQRINTKASTLPSSNAIIGLNRTTNVFNVATNVTSKYTAGTIIQVTGSTANDGVYTVVSSAFGANTAITVTETISSATADGTILVVNTV